MSTFYTSVSCYKLIDSDGNVLDKEQAMPILLQRISELSQEVADELWDEYDNVIDSDDEAGELEEKDFNAFRLRATRKYLESSISVLFDDYEYDQDVVTIISNGRKLATTGGLSGGDTPTEAYDPIGAIATSEITVLCADGSMWINPALKAAITEYLNVADTSEENGCDEAALRAAAVAFDTFKFPWSL